MADGNIGDNSAFDYDDLQRLLDELAGKQTAISEATGSLRSRLKEIIESREWHKGALSMVRKIDAMSETARADFLRTFEPMFDVMVSKKWRDDMSDLFKDDTETES